MFDDDIQLRLQTLGERLRLLRVDRGHSLGEVAAGTGLSTSFLSLVENGRSDISTGRLFRVAHFLGIGLGDLLQMNPAFEVTVVRADERRPADGEGEGLSMFPVVPDHEGIAMAPVVCEYEVGAHVLDVLGGVEGVEHFLFVVSGAIEITMGQMAPLLLAQGDCAYLRVNNTSSVRNAADGRSVMLWVSSLSGFGKFRADARPDLADAGG